MMGVAGNCNVGRTGVGCAPNRDEAVSSSLNNPLRAVLCNIVGVSSNRPVLKASVRTLRHTARTAQQNAPAVTTCTAVGIPAETAALVAAGIADGIAAGIAVGIAARIVGSIAGVAICCARGGTEIVIWATASVGTTALRLELLSSSATLSYSPDGCTAERGALTAERAAGIVAPTIDAKRTPR
jgi:hypothetical protein